MKQKAFPKAHTIGKAIGFSCFNNFRTPALNVFAQMAPSKTARDARVVYSISFPGNT